MKKIYLSAIGLLALMGSLASAATGSVSTKAGPEKKWGTYVAIGNPYPSLLGINAAYNATENIRAVIGYGEIEVTTSIGFSAAGFDEKKTKATTYTAGADYLFTDWSFRPSLGARIGYFNIEGDGDFEVQGFNKSAFIASGNFGIDYLGQSGYYAATGLNVAVVGGSGTGFYANMGYFF